MKTNNIFRLLTLAVAAIAFAFVTACEGPAGKDGVDGAIGPQGPAGADGQDINETCKQCHEAGTDMLNRAQQQFGESGHALGTRYDRSFSECAGCHNTEGFLSRVGLTGTAEWEAAESTSALTQISCYTCHNLHSTYTEADWGLTNTAQVVTLFGQEDPNDEHDSYSLTDAGKSNLCMQCHQSRDRGGVPTPTSTDDVSITSSHWGPHYGIQGQIFYSFNQAGYEGAEAYPTEGSPFTAHENLDCMACHMGEASNHTLEVQYDMCASCHITTPAEDRVETLNEEIHTSLYALGAYLRDNYDAMTGDNVNGYSPKSSETPYPAKVGRAVWSYMVVYQDHSYGAHNPQYIRALIANSMEEIQLP